MAKLKTSPQREKHGFKWTQRPLMKWEHALFNDPMLGWRDKAVFMAIHALKTSGNTYPTLKEVCEQSGGMSQTAMKQCCGHLEYAGWLEMSVRPRTKNDIGGGIEYTLWYRK